MKEMKIKAVIFDMGGVAINWSDKIVYRHISAITGLKEKDIEKIANHYMKLFDTGKISEQTFWNDVAEKLGYKKGLKGNWLAHYGNHANQNAAVFGAIKKVKRQGYLVATLTNVIRPHYVYNKKHHLYKLFDNVYVSCQLKMRKPSRKIYLYVISHLKLKPHECLFIDDRAENVTAARKAGMKSFIFRNARQMKKELRKYNINI